MLGVANIATGFFQGFPISTSSSRTAVAEDIGAAQPDRRARPAPSCSALLLIVGTGLVHDLPLSTLAAIVIVAVLGLIDIAAARRLRSWRRSEFTLAMVAFAGVAVLGVLWGVGIAIALSLLNFIRRAWRPHDAVLGRVDNLKGYHDTERYPDARLDPGTRAVPLRRAAVLRQRRLLPRARPRAGRTPATRRWIVVAAEPITDIDATAGETLSPLNGELDAAGIELAFAELKDPVRDRLRRYGIEDAIGDSAVLPDRRRRRGHLPATRPASTGSTGRIVDLSTRRLPGPLDAEDVLQGARASREGHSRRPRARGRAGASCGTR